MWCCRIFEKRILAADTVETEQVTSLRDIEPSSKVKARAAVKAKARAKVKAAVKAKIKAAIKAKVKVAVKKKSSNKDNVSKHAHPQSGPFKITKHRYCP